MLEGQEGWKNAIFFNLEVLIARFYFSSRPKKEWEGKDKLNKKNAQKNLQFSRKYVIWLSQPRKRRGCRRWDP